MESRPRYATAAKNQSHSAHSASAYGVGAGMSVSVLATVPTVPTMFDLRHAHLDDRLELEDLLRRCESADGRPPLSEFKALRVPVANAVRSIVAQRRDGAICALAVAAWHPAEIGEEGGYWAAEIAIDPGQRSVEAYDALLVGLERELESPPSFWAFDAMQAAAAAAHGMSRVRRIVEMNRKLPAPPYPLPEGIAVRPFVIGADEADWLELNQRVFGNHPEAGSIDASDLALRMSQPWFDPDGFLILVVEDDLAGYCWTKRHSASVGEIYMIGLAPEYRGRRLARPLTAAGLEYLAATGATESILYAEAANAPAIRLYESMGFEVVRTLTLFSTDD